MYMLRAAIAQNVTALVAAAGDGRTDVVRRFVTGGVSVNTADRRGVTPLLAAAAAGHTEVVQVLVAAGATVDQAYTDGCAPLFVAAQNNHTHVVSELLKANAAVDRPGVGGSRALFIAAQQGHAAVVRQLLHAGAAVDQATTRTHDTPLAIAASEGHLAVVECLCALGRASVSLPGFHGHNALHWAVDPVVRPRRSPPEANHFAIATLLVAHGATADLNSFEAGSPQQAAVRRGLQMCVYAPLWILARTQRLGRSLRRALPPSLVALVGEYFAPGVLEAVTALEPVLLRPETHSPQAVWFMFLHGGG
jgi:ankyrin repeat protein